MLITIFTLILLIIIAARIVLPILGWTLEMGLGILGLFGLLFVEFIWMRWLAILALGYLGAMVIFGW
jgi:hypothetical protein